MASVPVAPAPQARTESGSRPQVNDAVNQDAFYLLTVPSSLIKQNRKEGQVKVPGVGAVPQMSSPHSCPAHIERAL